MIWYDTVTRGPVAPGSCEDSGIPSIENYFCVSCNDVVQPYYLEHDGAGYARCRTCGFILLTTQ